MYPKNFYGSVSILLAISNHATASHIFRPPHNITFTALPTTLSAYPIVTTTPAMRTAVEDTQMQPCKGGTIMCLSSGAAKQAGPPIEERSVNSTNNTIAINIPEDIPYDISSFLASTGGEFPNLDLYSPSHLDPDGEPIPTSEAPNHPATSNLLTLFADTNFATLHRCPHGEKSVRRANAPGKGTNGCGTANWMKDVLPGAKKFNECCNGHDICFSTCASDFAKCYLDFSTCMNDRCGKFNIFRRAWCQMERMAYLTAVQGDLAIKAWKEGGEKRCECVKG